MAYQSLTTQIFITFTKLPKQSFDIYVQKINTKRHFGCAEFKVSHNSR